MESSDNLASRHKTFTYHRQYYSEVDIFLMGCVCVCVCVGGGEGVNTLRYNILTLPPPSKKYSRTVFVHGNQWQLSFKTQNIYISQTILIGGWHFFLMGCGGGGQYIMVKYTDPPPPSKKNIQEQFLYMESSDN